MGKKKARKNRGDLSVDPSLNLSPAEMAKGGKEYDAWHWGIGPQRVVDGNDPDMPRMLIECGRLVRLHVRLPREPESPHPHPRRRRDAMIQLSRRQSVVSHVAYDPNERSEPIYLLLDKGAQAVMKQRFWVENRMPARPLQQLAVIAGGRHAHRPYPNVMVKPVGVLTAIVYFTTKRGDGQSYYIHQVGEISEHYPILCCDSKGRLWLAGGNYSSPPPGITD